jgi:hypothetical protein
VSEIRPSGSECPLIAQARAHMTLCQPCVYFRGASLVGPEGWRVVCNWPRNGSELASNAPKEEKPNE